MSVKQQILVIYPVRLNMANEGEVESYSGFTCPTCNGRGYFDYSGWMRKHKKEGEPDYKECVQCKGTGRLRAIVVVKWEAEDLPSLCPENMEE